jgi:hypothetical protein
VYEFESSNESLADKKTRGFGATNVASGNRRIIGGEAPTSSQGIGGESTGRSTRKGRNDNTPSPPSLLEFFFNTYSSSLSRSLLSSSRLPSLDAGRRLSTPGSFGLGFAAWGFGVPGWDADPFCCPLAPLAGAEELGLGEPFAGGAGPGGG